MLSNLTAIITPTVNAAGFQLYGCRLNANGNRPTLLVYIDGERGVTIDDCAKISRQLAAVLDVEASFKGAYELQVSSPGIDRPLFTIDHYQQAVGKKVKLTLRQPYQQQRRFVAVLKKIADQQLSFLLDNGEMLEIDFAQIDKATLIGAI